MSVIARRLRWALAVSLGVNLFLLAYGLTRWVRHPASTDPTGQHDTRAQVTRGSREHGLGRLFGPPSPEVRDQHRALHSARREVGDALSANPYDAERLKKALSNLRTTTGHGQELLHQKLLERAGQLSVDERTKLARSRFVREFSGDAPSSDRARP